MAVNKETYTSPLSTRYASREMQYLFSEDFKFRTWRRLWVSLARAERMLGLDISKEQIAEMEAHVDDVNYDVAEARERAPGLRPHRNSHHPHVLPFQQSVPWKYPGPAFFPPWPGIPTVSSMCGT